MFLYKKLLIMRIVFVLCVATSASAQDAKETPQDQKRSEGVTAVDSISSLTKELSQQELLETSNLLNDNALPIVQIGDKKAFDLKDNEAAARYDSLWMKELYDSASLYDDMYAEVVNLDPNATFESSIHTDTLKKRLQLLNQKTPFNVAYNPSLENVIKSFLARKRGLIERMLTVSQFYFPLFEEQLDKYDIPLEMKYLSIVESALNPRARSRVGATGLWQFMYGTGKMYKLNVSSYVDERRDPIKSTEAACRYLSKLYDIFDDWDLALAAYNSGPGNVNKAIRRSGGYKNYWNIRRNLPRETAGYVPAFLATMYLFEYAEEHGIRPQKINRTFFETDTIHVKSLITFDQIAELVGVGIEEIKVLNPAYKLNIIPYEKGKPHILRLPKPAMGKFVANEEAIYAHVKEQIKNKEQPLPQLVKADDRIRYRVRSGDYLGKIAKRYGVGVSQIKRWNGLRSNNLRVGQRLTIYSRRAITPTSTAKKSAKPPIDKTQVAGAKVHTVQQGDSLWTISRKYPGISIENLREWNGISGNNLKPGTKLKLCDCSS